MMNFAIVYMSFGGNTRALAIKLQYFIKESGHKVHLYTCKDKVNLEEYDYVLIGSLTWEKDGKQGQLPIQMRKYLKEILINNPQKIKRTSVFGTGETQWGVQNYCRAVDEIAYHLTRNNIKVNSKLKIEQNPIGKDIEIKKYINEILEVFK